MSVTQIILLVIAAASLFLAAEMMISVARSKLRAQSELPPDWRAVGTFGRMSGGRHDPGPVSSGPISLKAVFVLLALAAAGVSFKFAWDEAHPDIRTRYGRAYELCVSESHLNRWQIDQVRSCAEARMWR